MSLSLSLTLCLACATVGAQGEALRPKATELEAPCFAFSGRAPFVILGAETTQLFGATVTVEIGKRGLELTPKEGRRIRVTARRGKEMSLPRPEADALPIRVERIELGGHLRGKPDEGMESVWVAYPHVASEAQFGKQDRVLCIDYDADGVLWEPGEDAVVYPESRSAIPLGEELIVGTTRYRLRVGEIRGKRTVFAEAVEEMQGIDGKASELASIRFWNEYRAGVGVPPTWLDPQLSKDCAAHCRYMQLNPRGTGVARTGLHTEDPSRQGYTRGGSEAGKYSCIWNTEYAEEGIRSFLTSIYHKAPLIYPHTPKCGIACRDGATLYDGHRGREGKFEAWPILVPGPGQTISELAFGKEYPDPRPSGESGGGHAILLVFDFWNSPATKVEASLARRVAHNRFEDVPVWVSDPTAPANAARPQNDGCICLIPQKALAGRSIYRPRVAYVDKNTGERRVFEWEFYTR